MRGTDETSGSLFSYVDLEERIPARHPLRKIRQVVNDALASLDAEFETLYTDFGRPSIPPERLVRASLLQILFSVRSERQLMEQMESTVKCGQSCSHFGFGRRFQRRMPLLELGAQGAIEGSGSGLQHEVRASF